MAKKPDTDNTVTLDQPIKRGDTEIREIILRKPNAGELRGLHLADLLQLDVSALIKLLPRISSPTLTEQDATAMDPADLLACGTKVASFLLQKQDRIAASLLA